MALSYLREAQINAGLLAEEMKQESEKQSRSPPLNNNPPNPLFPVMGSAATGLSMLTPHQQLMAARTAVLMASGIPMSLQATFATSSLYQHQNLFSGWVPPPVSSPPSPLHHSSSPISPVTKMNSRKATNINNNNTNNNNNNNVVSSSADRIMKKTQGVKRKAQAKTKLDTTSGSLEGGTSPISPPIPASLEGAKDSRDKVFTCGVCSRSFGYKHVLQNHERTHTGEKPFKCPECHKRFTRDHHLKTHMRLHTGEKPYHCSHCDRQFVQVANLRRHLRVHTGERPYACELCSAKFSDSNQLKAHLLIHKGEKPFECEHCRMRFRRRHHLMHHKCSINSGGASMARPNSMPHLASPSVTSEEPEEDVDVDIDMEVDADKAILGRRHASLRLPSPAVPAMPLNLSGNSPGNQLSALPEQTEPEDLSMSTGMHRPHSRSHSNGDSPLSRSPSSDTIHEDEDEEELDMSAASPSSLFLQERQQRRKNQKYPRSDVNMVVKEEPKATSVSRAS